ncbi:MAG: ABC transporter substrate-binding protein [Candidatus Syntrophopropionicum ammoniitolerans]
MFYQNYKYNTLFWGDYFAHHKIVYYTPGTAPTVFLSNRTGFLPVAGRVVGIAENQLIYGQSRDAVTLDQAWAEDDHSHKVIANIFEGLVRFQPGTNTIEPCLAEGWRVSADGREWTFFLRKGVKFHDGTPFNSDAVRFSVERQLPPQRTANNGYASFTFGMLESIRTPDQFTVQFILKYPYAPFFK